MVQKHSGTQHIQLSNGDTVLCQQPLPLHETRRLGVVDLGGCRGPRGRLQGRLEAGTDGLGAAQRGVGELLYRLGYRALDELGHGRVVVDAAADGRRLLVVVELVGPVVDGGALGRGLDVAALVAVGRLLLVQGAQGAEALRRCRRGRRRFRVDDARWAG